MKKETQIVLALMFVLALAVGILLYLKKKEKSVGLQNAAAPLQPAIVTPSIYTQQPQGVYTPPIYAGGQVATENMANATHLIKLVQAAFGLKVDGVLGEKTKQVIAQSGIDISSPKKFVEKMLSIKQNTAANLFPLKKGSKNNYVKGLQLFLNLTPDGNFGAGTEAALLQATGATQVFHKQYAELFSVYTNVPITYNNKPLPNTSFSEAAKKLWAGISLPYPQIF